MQLVVVERQGEQTLRIGSPGRRRPSAVCAVYGAGKAARFPHRGQKIEKCRVSVGEKTWRSGTSTEEPNRIRSKNERRRSGSTEIDARDECAISVEARESEIEEKLSELSR